jgi:hypothetical protein
MTKEELKQALEALKNGKEVREGGGGTMVQPVLEDAAILAIEEALAQPAQEPVGVEWTPCIKRPHVVVHVRQQRRDETHVSTREGITPAKPDDLIMRGVEDEEYPIGRVLFLKTYTFDTSTPKPEWVGLTDTEIKRIGALDVDSNYFGLWYDFAKAIEAKLKEKNT